MKRTFIRRLDNLLRTNFKHFTSIDTRNNFKKWKAIKGQYAGRRVFLIANGPSLNVTPLYLLKNEYTIVFNRAQLILERLGYFPNFYMIADGVVAENIREDIMYFVEKCDYSFVPDISKGDLVDFTSFLAHREKLLWMYEEPIRFSKCLPFVSPGNTVIFRAFQVLRYMGFEEVVVVGNDMNYVVHTTADVLKEEVVKGKVNQTIQSQKDDDPNHFDPRYFGKGKVYHQPSAQIVEKIFKNLDVVADEFRKSGTKVINAGYNSKVECFPKQDFYECLGYSKKEIDDIFEELVRDKGFGSRKEFLALATNTSELWDDNRKIAAVSVTHAGDMIKSKIFDYLPVGPYEGKIYFINRKFLNQQH